MAYIITAARVYAHHRTIENGQILVDGDTIVAVEERVSRPGAEVIDLGSACIIPGLVDMHIHGCGGSDAMDASTEALAEMSRALALNGVVAFLPVVMTAQWDNMLKTLHAIKSFIETRPPGAKVLGAYVEGPFFSSVYRGAHPRELTGGLDMSALKQMVLEYGDVIKVFALAPELPGALEAIAYLKANNIRVALGHSNATYQETQQAIETGADLAVHVFNGMRPLHHREPGIVGAMLQDPRVRVELIADGIHIHPAMVDLVVRAKGVEGVCLVSDSMRAAGLPDGTYQLGETNITVKDAVARTPDGALAGSTARLMDCVKNAMDYAGLDVRDTIHMASLNPARYLGIDRYMGSIAPGKLANMAVIDQNFRVIGRVVSGELNLTT